jgi:hypothetical protein
MRDLRVAGKRQRRFARAARFPFDPPRRRAISRANAIASSRFFSAPSR